MSAEFFAEQGLLKGFLFKLADGDEWVIGRDPDQSTIVIEDPKVSRRHLKIRRDVANDYTIENLSETNPISLNGEEIHGISQLREGDLLTIADTDFRFYPKGLIEEGSSYLEYEYTDEGIEEKKPLPEEEVEEAVIEEETPESEEEDTIFEEVKLETPSLDLTETTRFILKVVNGPNMGAEFSLDTDKQYVIGTDTLTCDIVFNDLSVSREHARLFVNKDGLISIEDLNSRNGVIIDREKIIGRHDLDPNQMVALGTTIFLIIDKEAPAQTIVAPMAEAPEEAPKEELVAAAAPIEKIVVSKPRSTIAAGSLILALIIGSLAVLFGLGVVSLFHPMEIELAKPDYVNEIQTIINRYPAVRFTFSPTTGKLFLVGHVSTGIELNELLYQLKTLPFIRGIENNIVNDEAIWQEMNILLSKHADFKGVSMHSPSPGTFVLNGYLQNEKQFADLIDYINVNFNYINLLENRVVVEEQVLSEVNSNLLQLGFGAVTTTFSNGELQLTGYISTNQVDSYNKLLNELGKIPGVRSIKNFVVALNVEQQGVIDLNQRYPGRYVVTGYSKHGDVNVNVVINGKLLSRGESIDGYIVTSIQPNVIFLEKDGLKYKIEYNR